MAYFSSGIDFPARRIFSCGTRLNAKNIRRISSRFFSSSRSILLEQKNDFVVGQVFVFFEEKCRQKITRCCFTPFIFFQKNIGHGGCFFPVATHSENENFHFLSRSAGDEEKLTLGTKEFPRKQSEKMIAGNRAQKRKEKIVFFNERDEDFSSLVDNESRIHKFRLPRLNDFSMFQRKSFVRSFVTSINRQCNVRSRARNIKNK